ncbi:hypothetical protein Hanom_Chr04g00344111 [Helianthus anomalus]
MLWLFFHCFFGRSFNFQVYIKLRDRRFFIEIITVISYRLHQLTFLVFDYSLIRSFLPVSYFVKDSLMRFFLICYRLFQMDTPNARNSECELVSENEVVSKAKGKKTQRKRWYVHKIGCVLLIIRCLSKRPFLTSRAWKKEFALKQPSIIIDETVYESYETSKTT